MCSAETSILNVPAASPDTESNFINTPPLTSDAASEVHVITAAKFNSFSPTWSSKGLYYLSDGDVHTTQSSPWGTRAPGPVWDGRCNVFLAPFEGQAGETLEELAGVDGGDSGDGSDAGAAVLNFAVKPYPLKQVPASTYSQLVNVVSGEGDGGVAYVIKKGEVSSGEE